MARPGFEQRTERMREALRKAGVRLTHQRLEIFREVIGSGEHPDAETVFRGVRRRLPTVSLDTVYRTLWTLTDLGLLSTLGPRRERARFDANLEPHHHFICMRCRRARDFESAELDALRGPESVRAFGSVREIHVELRGLCAECGGAGSDAGSG